MDRDRDRDRNIYIDTGRDTEIAINEHRGSYRYMVVDSAYNDTYRQSTIQPTCQSYRRIHTYIQADTYIQRGIHIPTYTQTLHTHIHIYTYTGTCILADNIQTNIHTHKTYIYIKPNKQHTHIQTYTYQHRTTYRNTDVHINIYTRAGIHTHNI